MEIYVDDMLVKSKQAETHVSDLEKLFQTLRRYSLKLNPVKCVCGTIRKILGVYGDRERNIDQPGESTSCNGNVNTH